MIPKLWDSSGRLVPAFFCALVSLLLKTTESLIQSRTELRLVLR